MRMNKLSRSLALVVAVAVGAGTPAMSVLARSKKPVYQAPPPPPPPPAGPVALPDRLMKDAASYDSYMHTAIATSPGFTDPDSVSLALRQSAAYSPKGMVRGAIAYAAIAALQEKPFVAALRQAGNTPEHRAQMVGYLEADPGYAYQFQGANAAAGRAREALGPTSLQLYTTGRAVKQAAYDIQHQSWSRADVADLKGRLGRVEGEADAEMSPASDRLAAEEQAIAAAAPPANTPTPDPVATNAADGAPPPPPHAPLIAHAVQLAAIAALGEATDANLDGILNTVTADEDSQHCLASAKRNFHQCLAVAKPNYEDVFCMGQHALRDTGACLADASGYQLPPEPTPPPKAKPAPAKHRRHRRA
jgi:hypothetical protein